MKYFVTLSDRKPSKALSDRKPDDGAICGAVGRGFIYVMSHS